MLVSLRQEEEAVVRLHTDWVMSSEADCQSAGEMECSCPAWTIPLRLVEV